MNIKKLLKLALGLIASSYFIHIESVIVPVYLKGSIAAYDGVSVALSCIVWCAISLSALIVLIILNLLENKKYEHLRKDPECC